MLTHQSRPGRRAPLRRVGAAAGVAFAGLALALAVSTPAQAETKTTTDTKSAFQAAVQAVIEAGDQTAADGAVAELAELGFRTETLIQYDLFRAFRNCLAAAAHGDSMYPGIDDSEVNNCMGL
jgi:hypothetical protein